MSDYYDEDDVPMSDYVNYDDDNDEEIDGCTDEDWLEQHLDEKDFADEDFEEDGEELYNIEDEYEDLEEDEDEFDDSD